MPTCLSEWTAPLPPAAGRADYVRPRHAGPGLEPHHQLTLSGTSEPLFLLNEEFLASETSLYTFSIGAMMLILYTTLINMILTTGQHHHMLSSKFRAFSNL